MKHLFNFIDGLSLGLLLLGIYFFVNDNFLRTVMCGFGAFFLSFFNGLAQDIHTNNEIERAIDKKFRELHK